MRFSVAAIIILTAHSIAFSQARDSLIFEISKVETTEQQYWLYRVTVYNNNAEIPACLLHSTYINLGFQPAPKLALSTKDTPAELFSLLYTTRDTLNDYENTNSNFNGEPILPRQKIEFDLFIPKGSTKERYLKFDYLYVPDFCYEDFKKKIFKNASTWHEKYRKISNQITLTHR
jgi:hypothetical protein